MTINHLMGTFKPQSNGPLYSSTVTVTGTQHWPLMGGLLHLVQQGLLRGLAPPSPFFAVSNVTAHPSTATGTIIIRCDIIITYAHERVNRWLAAVSDNHGYSLSASSSLPVPNRTTCYYVQDGGRASETITQRLCSDNSPSIRQ